ncbi:MAG: hypothetical protein LBR17_05260, partial [Bacteroidales bacterium]|nr:hypothetical protein [Bacteroidales bacterium]
ERKEIIRILTEFSDELRLCITDLLMAYDFLYQIDFIRAKGVVQYDKSAVVAGKTVLNTISFDIKKSISTVETLKK